VESLVGSAAPFVFGTTIPRVLTATAGEGAYTMGTMGVDGMSVARGRGGRNIGSTGPPAR